ncbi:hypothetical protein MA16_Dca027103 [Dendrobium catenatum]|uniref:Uncharacterized protein n=1 Tax=Dendrobium catenatum TaxID=906689 RepID=A0A2I0V9Y6_9ASPA|nr:hypothetical protein MA16_Dca027103 [Dendrobium catenatum]
MNHGLSITNKFILCNKLECYARCFYVPSSVEIHLRSMYGRNLFITIFLKPKLMMIFPHTKALFHIVVCEHMHTHTHIHFDYRGAICHDIAFLASFEKTKKKNGKQQNNFKLRSLLDKIKLNGGFTYIPFYFMLFTYLTPKTLILHAYHS